MTSSRRRRMGDGDVHGESAWSARELESKTSRQRTLDGGVCLVYFTFSRGDVAHRRRFVSMATTDG